MGLPMAAACIAINRNALVQKEWGRGQYDELVRLPGSQSALKPAWLYGFIRFSKKYTAKYTAKTFCGQLLLARRVVDQVCHYLISCTLSEPSMPTIHAAVTLTTLSLLFTASAYAEVFKCSGADGKVEYRDKPCADGIVGKRVPLVPAPTQAEVYAAKQVASRNADALKKANTVPANGIPVFMEKILGQMKMNDIQRNEALRQSDKKK